MNPPYRPNAEQAGVAWAKTIPEVDASKVATKLPADVTKWASTGFVVVSNVGGSTPVGIEVRQSVLSFDCYWANPNSEKTPWGEARALAESVFHGFFIEDLFPQRFEIPSFLPVSVRSGWTNTEPRRVPGSVAGYAHVSFDATIAWCVAR